MQGARREQLLIAVGCLLMLLGAACNPWFVGMVFARDGTIGSPTNRALIWVSAGLLTGLGASIVKWRKTIGLGPLTRANCLVLAGAVLAAIVVAELMARCAGYQPFRPGEIRISVEPGGRLYQRHSELGYVALPGTLRVALRDGYSFRVTHLPDGRRITRPLETYGSPRTKPEIWVFGCSYTYGWSLNDEETYPWLVQEGLLGHEVVSFGLNGYGTVQSLIQFRQAIRDRGAPQVAILGYLSMHDQRNTMSRGFRKRLVPWQGQGIIAVPSAELSADGSIVLRVDDVCYREWPAMQHSSLVHLLEDTYYNRIAALLARSRSVTKGAIAEFSRLASRNRVQLVVAGIGPDEATREMLADCRRKGILTVDISVDPKDPANTNLPHDPHPSAVANRKYADALVSFLNAYREAGPAAE